MWLFHIHSPLALGLCTRWRVGYLFFCLGKAGHLGCFGGCGTSGIYTFGKSCELVSMASNVHGGMSSKELSEMPAEGCGRTKICGWTLCIWPLHLNIGNFKNCKLYMSFVKCSLSDWMSPWTLINPVKLIWQNRMPYANSFHRSSNHHSLVQNMFPIPAHGRDERT